MQSEKGFTQPVIDEDTIDASDWQSRIIFGHRIGAATFERRLPTWLEAAYQRLRKDVIDPRYPCFFGTQAEKRGEMFYSWVDGKDVSSLPETMTTFAQLAELPKYEKNNIAIFFEPDKPALSHEAYRDIFWQTLQYLHDHDPDPKVGRQLDPSHPDWEFSFAGLQTFVVCACPSFRARHSRNLGPGMVLLFQPRAVFVDKVTNRAISTQARTEVRHRLLSWDEVPPHADLGYYGDAENREWKQYFLPDDETPNLSACPFLRRNPGPAQPMEPPDTMPSSQPWPETANPSQSPATLLDVMAQHVAQRPGATAIRFLVDGENDERALSYCELDMRAKQLAAVLAMHAAPGDRALLLLPSGLDYVITFLACLHAGVIAVPAYPPDPIRAQAFQRLQAILKDASPRLLLTDSAHRDAIQALTTIHAPCLEESEPAITLLVDDPINIATGPADFQRNIHGDTVAFLQYTSGSTAEPKGVMISQANLLANEQAISRAMAFTPSDIMVSWLPLYHDMGLIGGLLAPLYSGFPLVLMTPEHFLEAPRRWLKAMAHYRGTVSGGPNFAFQLCVERIRGTQLDGLSLASWRIAFCGSEPIRAETLELFAKHFAPRQFHAHAMFPCYGLAEATLLVSGAMPGGGMKTQCVDPSALAKNLFKPATEGLVLVSCGQVPDRHAARIASPDAPLPLGNREIGEICIRGPSVTAGYWGQPETSAAKFVTLEDTQTRWMRTGDLGCLYQGELFVTGRVKDLIIIRGQNHYPQDLEATVARAVDRVRKSRIAAFAIQEDGIEGIGIAAEVPRAITKSHTAGIFAQINHAIAEAHGEAVQLILLLSPGQLPRTSSGKLRRSACAAGWRDRSLSTVATYQRQLDPATHRLARPAYREPRSTLEHELVQAWEEILGHAPIGLDDNFFDLGGDSLKAAKLAARIGTSQQMALSMRFIFEAHSIAAQARWIARQNIAGGMAAPRACREQDSADGDQGPHPLSPAQEGLYFEWKLKPDDTAYHVSAALCIRGALDPLRLHKALAKVCANHDALQVRFDQSEDGPYQVRHTGARFSWQTRDLSGQASADRAATLRQYLQAAAQAPFDLSHDPLLRAVLVRLGSDEYIVQITMHHIATDAWSFALILQSLLQHYDASTPASTAPSGYFTGIRRSRQMLNATRSAAQLAYWQKQLGEPCPELNLPFKRHHRPCASSGARCIRHVPTTLSSSLDALVRTRSATLPMGFLAAFAALLYRYSGQTDLRIGVPLNIRDDGSENTVGYFVNTIVLRIAVSGALSFDELLSRIRAALLDAQENRDVPFQRIVAALRAQSRTDQSSPFQVMFNFDSIDWGQVLHSNTLQLQRFESAAEATPFALALNLSLVQEGVRIAFDYPLERLETRFVEAFADAYIALIGQMAEEPGAAIRDVVLPSDNEPPTKTRPVQKFQSTHGAFTAIARLHSQRIAIECGDRRLSYAELDHWSDRIARQLLEQKSAHGPDACIGLCVERSPGIVAGILGIWKSGSPFVPLDPAYPKERLQYMARDAGLGIILSDTRHNAHANDIFHGHAVLDIDALSKTEMTAPPARQPPHPEQLAYVIYTSGSTGQPKGVAISHQALVLHLTDFIEAYGITEHDRQLQSSTISFDVALHEIFPALLKGGRILMRDSQAWDLAAMNHQLIAAGVTFARMPTAYWQQWLQSPPPHAELGALRQITVGGEALPGDALARWHQHDLAGIQLDNLYGPTETTIACLRHRTCLGDAQQAIAPIGRPFPSRSARIIDADGNIAPGGVAGELCIGGATLARGYLGRPALTAERFVPDAYGPPGARCYRSGDLCRQRVDGSFDFLGRMDRQLKLRGFRIEPEEIEAALRGHPDVQDAVVDLRSKHGHEQLVGYLTGPGRLDLVALRHDLNARLPPHMVPSALMQIDVLPLMPNGKIDRQALPEPDTANANTRPPYRAPRHRTEQILLEIWQAVLNTSKVSVYDHFFEIGGDSILSLQIVARAAQRGLKFSLQQFYAHPVIAELALMVRTVDEAPTRLPAEKHHALPLTPIQAWFFRRFPQGQSHWNQTMALRVQGELDPTWLSQALHALVAAYDALRLKFFQSGDGWQQQVQPCGSLPAADELLKVVDFDETSSAPAWPGRLLAIGTDLQHGLDISEGRLFRAVYIRLRGEARLLLTIHHLAVDGVSWRLLLESFQRAYEQLAQGQAAKLPAVLPWSAWVEQQAQALDATAAEQDLAAWKAALAPAYATRSSTATLAAILGGRSPDDAIAVTALPRIGDSRSHTLQLTAELTALLLHQAPAGARATTESLLLAALLAALRRHCNANGALLSLESHGRPLQNDHAEHDPSHTVGWFTQRYPAWFELGDKPLATVKRRLRMLPIHGNHKQAPPEPIASSLPLPQVSFNYLGRFDQALPRTGLLADRLSFALDETYGESVSDESPLEYALDINAWVANGQLALSLRHHPASIKVDTVQALAADFAAELTTLLSDAAAGRIAPDASDFPLAMLDQPALDALHLDTSKIQDIYPATPLQKGLLFHGLMEGGHGLYINQLRLTLQGPLDRQALWDAWQAALTRHDILRTTFRLSAATEPLQIVQRTAELAYTERDWSGHDMDRYQSELQAWCDEDRRRGFDLEQGPLLRLALFARPDGGHDLLRTNHHALLDGWSSARLLGEIADDYAARTAKRPALRIESTPYRRYVEWLQAQPAPRDWWQAQLDRHPEPATLLPDQARPLDSQAGLGTPIKWAQVLGEARVSRLHQTARRYRVTVNTLVQAAWGLVLARHTYRRQVVFGATVAGRNMPWPEAERMIGLFINSLPVWLDVPSGTCVSAWLSEIHRIQTERQQVEHTALNELQHWSNRSGDALFDSLLIFENYPLDAALRGRFGTLQVSAAESMERTHYPLTLLVSNDEQGHVTWMADGARIHPAQLSQLSHEWHEALSALCDPKDRPVGALELIPATPCEAPLRIARQRFQPIGARLAAQAARHPERIALVCSGHSLSYAELEAWSNRIGRRLLRLGVQPEQPIGLCIERSNAMVAGLYGIAKTGAAYVPLDPHHPAQRLQPMLEDAGIEQIVVDAAGASRLSGMLDGRKLIHIDKVAEESPLGWELAIDPRQTVYVIYTSGSTGRPKGVSISHASLDRLLASLADRLGFSERDAWLSVTTLSFDIAGLELHLPLTRGARVELAPYEAVLDGSRLLQLMEQSKASVMQATPAVWRMLLASEARAGIRLPAGIKALCGGEALPADLAEALLARGLALYNMYGPTETTIWSSMARLNAGEAITLGKALHHTRLEVMDQDGRPAQADAIGELCIGGDNLARGYLGQPGLTALHFVPDAYGMAGARLYRTGDLCRRSRQGNLTYLGRLDQQLKLNGHRIEPAEIEIALRLLDGVQDAAVLLHEHEGGSRLTAYLVCAEQKPLDRAAWRAALAKRLPRALLPTAWVVLDRLPTTASGKLDRKRLPQPVDDAIDPAALVAPRTPQEAQLLAIWRRLLPMRSLGVTTDFFAAGGDSITSLRMISAAFEAGLDLSPRQVFQFPTIEQLARLATPVAAPASAGAAASPDAAQLSSLGVPASEQPSLQDASLVTPLQQGMLSLAQRANRDPYYLQRIFSLTGPFSLQAFASAWQETIQRHPALRTDFLWEGCDTPLQLVRKQVAIDIEVLDWQSLNEQQAHAALATQWQEARAQGFDFSCAAQPRLLLIKRGSQRHWFVWRFHHTQLDGWSLGIVLRDVLHAYAAALQSTPSCHAMESRPAPSFSDYARWLAQRNLKDEVLPRWRSLLASWSHTPLPLASSTFAASSTQPAEGEYSLEHSLILPHELTLHVEAFARACGITLSTLLQGAWAWLLARHANRRQVSFGVTVSGRGDGWQASEATVGLFINSLPLSIELPPATVVGAWLSELQERNLAIQELSFTPLALLQREIGGTAAEPLFESIFVFENYPLDTSVYEALPQGLAIERIVADRRQGMDDGRNHFPLSLIAIPGECLHVTLAAQATHFDHATIQRLLEQWQQALRLFSADAQRPLGALQLDQAPRQNAISLAAGANPPHNELLARIAQHALQRPHDIALLDEIQTLDWASLWHRSGILAAHLIELGIGLETTVAVMLPRCVDLVASMLAIWRAGGIYAPLDPEAPAERLAWQINDAQADCLMAPEDTAWRPAEVALLVPTSAIAKPGHAALDARLPQLHALPADRAAYLIYTSGSSGRPKGVLVSQRSLSAYIKALLARLPGKIRSATYLSTPAADLGHSSLMTALWSGWTLQLIDQRRAFDADHYQEWCRRHPSDLLKIAPSHLEGLLHAATPHAVLPQQVLLLGGEPCPGALLEQIRAWRPQLSILGHYGPTETTVGVLTSQPEAAGHLPLGRPLDHAQVYLLDSDGHPALPGAPGEICIGGCALARGYFGRAALSAERFIPDPQVPGARLYRTGDQARRLDDGQLAFLGRNDDQLKIHGYRVEPDEVSARLRNLPGVRDAIVIGRRDAQNRMRLLGYVTGEQLDPLQLRHMLANDLPASLLPAAIQILSAWPLTRNGKIDRAALPEPCPIPPAPAPAETPLQAQLLQIWRTVLQQPELGIDDNFFAAGGDSINAFQVLAQARRAGMVFSSRELFAQPSVRALSPLIQIETSHPNTDNRPRRATQATLSVLGFDPIRVQDAYPATPMQEGLLFHSLAQASGQQGIYLTQRRLTLDGKLDIPRLRTAWQDALDRHDILRAHFEWRDEQAWQVVERTVALPFAVHPIQQHEDSAEYEQRLRAWMETDLARGFDLTQAPLMRLDLFARPDGHHDLVWLSHHALMDGWSVARLLETINQSYRSGSSPSDQADSNLPYRAYVEWLSAQPESREWWLATAARCADPATLSDALAATQTPQAGVGRLEQPLAASLAARLSAAAARFEVTLNTLMQGAWALLLARYSHREQVVFGVTVSGRPETLDGAESILGLFINSLPVWMQVPATEDLGRWLTELQTYGTELRCHEHTSLAQLQRWVGRSGDALFDSLFVFENYPLDADGLSSETKDGLRVHAVQSAGRTHYPLTLMVIPQPSLRLEWEWDKQRFAEHRIESFAQSYIELLEQLAQPVPNGTTRPLHTVHLSAPRRAALPLSGHSFLPVPQRIAQVGRRIPHAIALQGQHHSLSYRQLQQQVELIARQLLHHGLQPEQPIAVALPRGPALPASMLATWLAGAVYLPIDPEHPQPRLRAMLEQTATSIAIVDDSTCHLPALADCRLVNLDRPEPIPASPLPSPSIHPLQLAYIIHTSGSTGNPKAVALTHAALDRLLAAMQRQLPLHPHDRWLSASAPIFDISLLEFCLPLLGGSTLHILPAQAARDGSALSHRLEASQASVLQATPSGWRMLLEAGWRTPIPPQPTPLLGLSGGEPLHPELALALSQRGVSLWNLYGPTETTIYSSGAQVLPHTPMTYGNPLPHTVLRVIDPQGQLLPDGAAGELCIGGDQLARGYLRQPALTAAAFLPDPDGPPGARLYRTGDLVRIDQNGQPVPLGRIDQQVKLRGHRIELGEVEAALCACQGVGNAAAAIKGLANRQRLIGYVTGTADPHALRQLLAQTLPPYMVPAAILSVASLPLTASGKLDRRALPEPSWQDPADQALPPRSQREADLLDIWQRVLGHPVHSVQLNFFEAGGDSISGVRMAAQIKEQIGRAIPLEMLFRHATIRGLADYLDAEETASEAGQTAAALSQLLSDFE